MHRANELLDRFGFAEVTGRLAETYSGGMRRRLDVVASLIMAPPGRGHDFRVGRIAGGLRRAVAA
jgi:ABC-type polar amino acid transport system ATPase subunit